MKKIFTLLIMMLVTVVATAQSFGFTFKGKTLSEGETVFIAAEEDLFSEMSCETNLPDNPTDGLMLVLNGMASANASAKIEITHNSLNPTVLQWCMGGECKPFNDATTLTKQFVVNGSTQVQFDATGVQSEGYLTAVLSVTIGLTTHKVNICFTNGDTSGMEKILSSLSKKEKYYNTNGTRVAKKNAHGVIIVSDGQTSRKVIKK